MGKKFRKRSLLEWAGALLLAAFIVFFLVHFIGNVHRVRYTNAYSGFEEGDIVWVDKWKGGGRFPFTPLRLPHTKPLSTSITFRYKRLFDKEFNRFDLVAFNAVSPSHIAPDLRPMMLGRIIGMPGDTLRIHYGKTYINGRLLPYTGKEIFEYTAVLDTLIEPELIKTQFNLLEIQELKKKTGKTSISFFAHRKSALKLAGYPLTERFSRMLEMRPNPLVYPTGLQEQNADNYGPLVIPYYGLEKDSLPSSYHLNLYDDFENQFYTARTDSGILFLHNYYFIMSDYRKKGNDSRFFGAIPEYLIVGPVQDRFHP